ncbi:MAG: hypothetical protein Q8N95_08750, partial [Desulfobacterales bacterium]|nr:hypothetical protein [Desulfobacterales bacterium]
MIKKLEPKQRALSLLLAAGLASELKTDTIPYGRRFPVACCGDLQSNLKDICDLMHYISICINGILKSKGCAAIYGLMRAIFSKILFFLSAKVYFGKDPANVPCRSFIFFPCPENVLCCGLAGIVSFKKEKKQVTDIDITPMENNAEKIEAHSFNLCIKNNFSIHDNYLCGGEIIRSLLESAGELKRGEPFFEIFINNKL